MGRRVRRDNGSLGGQNFGQLDKVARRSGRDWRRTSSDLRASQVASRLRKATNVAVRHISRLSGVGRRLCLDLACVSSCSCVAAGLSADARCRACSKAHGATLHLVFLVCAAASFRDMVAAQVHRSGPEVNVVSCDSAIRRRHGRQSRKLIAVPQTPVGDPGGHRGRWTGRPLLGQGAGRGTPRRRRSPRLPQHGRHADGPSHKAVKAQSAEEAPHMLDEGPRPDRVVTDHLIPG